MNEFLSLRPLDLDLAIVLRESVEGKLLLYINSRNMVRTTLHVIVCVISSNACPETSQKVE